MPAATAPALQATLQQLQALYALRAAGLHELSLSPREYVDVVRWLGNAPQAPIAAPPTIAKEAVLKIQLDAASGLTVLDYETYQRVQTLADDVARLADAEDASVAKIRTTLPAAAPNLAAVLNAETAARLLLRRSVDELARTQPDDLVGASSPLQTEPLVLGVPPKHRRQCVRMLAGKAVLAARADSGARANDTSGRQWRAEIERRVARLVAPPPSYKTRPLPVPITKPRPRRGGARVRKQKLKNRPSRLAQEQNLVRFGPTAP